MTVTLEDALNLEGKEAALSFEDMMAEMLDNVEEGGGYVRPELDEYTVRKMMLARHYLQQEADKLTEMKKQVALDWDRRINSKKEEIANIESLVDSFVREQNNGKSLNLDIGTAYMRNVGHKVKVKDKEKAREYLEEKGILEDFLKPVELDVTRTQNHFMDLFEEHVSQLTENQILDEVQQSSNGKITKKREKEIRLEIIEAELPGFNERLPEGFELVMPEQKLQIRSNIK